MLEYIGRSVWCDKHSIAEVKQNLSRQNIFACDREIAYLANKFILYLVETHKSKQGEIKSFLHRGGGYFLHFDSTHPGKGASHLMCAIGEEVEKKAQIVLGCAKLPTESTETVAEFLGGIKEMYEVQAYSMATLILEYKSELHGYGFPFDKANLVYLQRMKKVFSCFHGGSYQGKLEELYFILASILQDPQLQKTVYFGT